MRQPRGGLLFVLLIPIVSLLPLQQTEQVTTVVSGRLFVDLNANGAHDEGELVLGGIPIEFANGERIETVATAADGSFLIQVEPGLWRAALRPPEGFEYALPEGLELQVLETSEGQVELQIGLQPVQLLQVLVSALEAEAGEAEEPAEQSEPPAEGSEPGPEPEIYDGPFLPSDGSLDPSLLPESGSRLPPRLVAIAYSVGLLVAGLLAWSAGRLLQPLRSGAGWSTAFRERAQAPVQDAAARGSPGE